MSNLKVNPLQDDVALRLEVNGIEHTTSVQADTRLVDLLRDELGLSGTKVGCRAGNCGACTVQVNGEAVYSCLVLAAECADKSVVTIEGLADKGELSPVQTAFVQADAMQCGYCTPGQIMSLDALLRANAAPTDDDITSALAGNLCRCGAYRHIRDAAHLAVELRARVKGGSDAD